MRTACDIAGGRMGRQRRQLDQTEPGERRASATDDLLVGDASGEAATGVDVIVWPVSLTRRVLFRLPDQVVQGHVSETTSFTLEVRRTAHGGEQLRVKQVCCSRIRVWCRQARCAVHGVGRANRSGFIGAQIHELSGPETDGILAT